MIRYSPHSSVPANKTKKSYRSPIFFLDPAPIAPVLPCAHKPLSVATAPASSARNLRHNARHRLNEKGAPSGADPEQRLLDAARRMKEADGAHCRTMEWDEVLRETIVGCNEPDEGDRRRFVRPRLRSRTTEWDEVLEKAVGD